MSQGPSPYGIEPAPPPRANGNAIASLVCGIFSLTCCLPVAVLGLWLGVTARRRIAASQGAETGAGVALAGVILSAVGLALGLAFLALWVVIRIFGTGASGNGPVVG